MKTKPRQFGLTLTETMVVIAAAAMLTGFSMPAVRTFFKSMATSGGTRAVISAAMSSARAISAREQRYAGIRFQQDLYGHQYMAFIIHDTKIRPGEQGNLSCRAVEGLQPIKLSETVGVMDISLIGIDTDIDGVQELANATTFAILFSPSGKLVIHSLWVRNRDGRTDDNSRDDIFNTLIRITDPVNPAGMFVQDEIPDIEPSRRSFVIYDKIQFNKIAINSRLSDYLGGLDVFYINPYTGTIIER